MDMKSLVGRIAPRAEFRLAAAADSQYMVRWIPVLKCGDRYSMGIDALGNWVREEAAGIRILNTPVSFLRAQILLEQSLGTVRDQVTAFFTSLGVDVDALEYFPFAELVRAVLDSALSEYWVGLALNWYDELPLEKRLTLVDSLVTVRDQKGLPQKLRHRAGKALFHPGVRQSRHLPHDHPNGDPTTIRQ